MYRIITGIRSQSIEHSGIVVPDRTDMELLCPAFLVVHPREIKKNGTAEFQHFLRCRGLAFEGIPENLVYFLKFEVLSIEAFKTVVRKTASHLVEEIVTFLQRGEKVGII